uniref:Uncharacterized protein n=1 Tax=Glossina brevipalpis TaxID=37001 RepID=A0A1A9WWK1_9MUSC
MKNKKTKNSLKKDHVTEKNLKKYNVKNERKRLNVNLSNIKVEREQYLYNIKITNMEERSEGAGGEVAAGYDFVQNSSYLTMPSNPVLCDLLTKTI